MNIETKLKELKINLPNAPDPVGAYVAYKKINNLLYISGQLPISADGKLLKGKVGKEQLEKRRGERKRRVERSEERGGQQIGQMRKEKGERRKEGIGEERGGASRGLLGGILQRPSRQSMLK